jgi:tRNA(Ile)-lysidine synthetase-like protein
MGVLCYNSLDYPLYVRTYKIGDNVVMTYGTKKVSKLMKEKQIPSYQRNKLLFLVDKFDNILFIEDIYINKSLGDKNKLYITKIKEN